MEKWKKTVLALVICTIVLSGCVRPATGPTTEPTTEMTAETTTESSMETTTESTTEPTTEPATEPISMENLICVVQIHNVLAGINQGLGLQRYMYYAIRDSGVEPIDEETAKAIDRKLVDRDLRGPGSIFGNQGTNRWYTVLKYAPRMEDFESKQFGYRNDPWLPTKYGENLRIYYAYWGPVGDEVTAGAEVEAAMVQSVYAFYVEDPSQYSDSFDPYGSLTGFMTVANNGRILVEVQAKGLYRPMPDGSLELLVELPDSYYSVSYYWFPQK